MADASVLPLVPPGPVEAAIFDELPKGFTVSTIEVPGARLRVLEGGEGSPLVLLHGRGSAASSWFPMLPELSRKRRVIAFDLPGFGRSEARAYRGRTFEEGLAWFASPIEDAIVAMGLEAPSLAGHSLGGLVSLELALRGRVRPRKLALIGSMGLGPIIHAPARAFFLVGPERLARLVGKKGFRRVVPFPRSPLGKRLSALLFELYSVPRGRADATRAFNSLLTIFGAIPHRGDRLAAIEAPTLLIHGEKDEVFPIAMAERAASAMPNARVFRDPLGHSPHQDEPERITALVLDHFAS